MTQSRTLFVTYSCDAHGSERVRRNVAYTGTSKRDPGSIAAGEQVQITCSFPKVERTDDFARERGITVAGAFAVLCPECSRPMQQSRRSLFGSMSTGTACEGACQHAEGGNCKCSCGGARHGILA